MNRTFFRRILMMVLCALLTVQLPAAHAEEAGTGFYTGENGRYSFELAGDGICYWYQDGERFAGRYEAAGNGFSMKLIGGGPKGDTVMTAERLDDGALLVAGGEISGERFTASAKTQEITAMDQSWAARIRKARPSNGRISLTQTEMMDWNGIRIIACGYTADGNVEAIQLKIVNNSSDTIMLSLAGLWVNNTRADVFFYENLAPHEEKWADLQLNVPLLEAAGISHIENVTVSFAVQKDYVTVFESDPVSISVQDNRHRVPVMIPIRKNLLRIDPLRIDLLGYENEGTSLCFYLFIQNGSTSEFRIEGKNVVLNGQRSNPYISMVIKGSTAAVYSFSVRNAEYSGIGKLRQLELDLEFVEGYLHPFGKIQKLHMEYEKDGQLCAFSSDVHLDTESEFWQDHFAQPAEDRSEELSGFSRSELEAAIDLFKNYDLDDDR
ncbi:MAG: hypothetical protein K6C12_04000 [Oscillospiraceae bacterium]|nr:hypothetical protein [Oscillospiraceae bacterium]